MPKRPPIFGQQERKAEAAKRDAKRVGRKIYNSRAWRGKDGQGGQRMRVLVRDGFTCQVCGRLIVVPSEAHADHIEPLAEAVRVSDDELQCVCSECHGQKTRKEAKL